MENIFNMRIWSCLCFVPHGIQFTRMKPMLPSLKYNVPAQSFYTQLLMTNPFVELQVVRRIISKLKHLFRKNFKKSVRTYFRGHDSPLFRSPKYHLLEQISTDISVFGSLANLDAGTYEYSHRILKELHRKTSMRRSSAMDETISHINHESDASQDLLFKLPTSQQILQRKSLPLLGRNLSRHELTADIQNL